MVELTIMVGIGSHCFGGPAKTMWNALQNFPPETRVEQSISSWLSPFIGQRFLEVVIPYPPDVHMCSSLLLRGCKERSPGRKARERGCS